MSGSLFSEDTRCHGRALPGFFLELAFFAFFSLSLSSEESLFFFILLLSVDLDLREGRRQAVQERTKPETSMINQIYVIDFREGQMRGVQGFREC